MAKLSPKGAACCTQASICSLPQNVPAERHFSGRDSADGMCVQQREGSGKRTQDVTGGVGEATSSTLDSHVQLPALTNHAASFMLSIRSHKQAGVCSQTPARDSPTERHKGAAQNKIF